MSICQMFERDQENPWSVNIKVFRKDGTDLTGETKMEMNTKTGELSPDEVRQEFGRYTCRQGQTKLEADQAHLGLLAAAKEFLARCKMYFFFAGTEIKARDVAIQARDTQIQAKDAEIQAKDAEIQAKDSEILRLRNFLASRNVADADFLKMMENIFDEVDRNGGVIVNVPNENMQHDDNADVVAPIPHVPNLEDPA